MTLLGATIAATLPIIRQGYWQRRAFPGSEFFDALGILLLLHRARDHAPRTLGELDIGRRLQLEADYVADLLIQLKTLHLVGKLQQDRGQAHWALLCDAHTTTLRPLYEKLVLSLPRCRARRSRINWAIRAYSRPSSTTRRWIARWKPCSRPVSPAW